MTNPHSPEQKGSTGNVVAGRPQSSHDAEIRKAEGHCESKEEKSEDKE